MGIYFGKDCLGQCDLFGWVARGGGNGLVDVGYGKHLCVDHGKDEFVRGRVHVYEGFWAYAKTRLISFRGITKGTFSLHLKKCEFRFKHRGQNLYQLLLQVLRKYPLI